MASLVCRQARVTLRPLCRWASTSAPAAGSAVPAAQTPAPAAPARAPVASTELNAERGNEVTPAWARFQTEDTSGMDVAEARRVAVLSGVHDTPAVSGRVAVITHAQGGTSAMTSGSHTHAKYRIVFKHSDKWANPLMGWLSSADTQAPVAMHMRFDSVSEAALAAERCGWRYEIAPQHARAVGRVDNQYAYNFLPRDVQHRMKSLGPRRSTAIFAHPGSGKAAWVNHRHTTYGPDEWKPADYQDKAAWTGDGWPAPSPSAH